MEEGVKFQWLSAPKAFAGNGSVSQALVQRMRLTTQDASTPFGGRQSVIAVEGEHFPIPCTMAIKALGFDPQDLPGMMKAPHLRLNRAGTIAVDSRSFSTSIEGVFAAGDIVRGASLVVWAIRDGRDAANAMHRYVMAKQVNGKAA
jgi:glutamate synthase (NADPH/NADH) small chain